MPPQGRGIVKPSMTLAEFVTMQERGKAPPKGPAIQPEMSLLAWLAQKGEALGQALGTYDPWALAMPLEAPAKKVASKAASTLADFVKPITAYHGSPHDFDKFSLSKIGTGEGAQAYGHGLYFAENPGVAADYKDRLSASYAKFSHTDSDLVGGIANDKHDLPVRRAEIILAPTTSKAEALRTIEEGRSYLGEKGYTIAKNWVDDGSVHWPERGGKTYEVAINAHPDDFLDWDKPLSQQSEKVRKALEGLGVQSDLAKANPMMAASPVMRERGVTGSQALDQIKRGGVSEDVVSAKLKAAGIKGVRYLDQGSRPATYSRTEGIFPAAEALKRQGLPAAEAEAALGKSYRGDAKAVIDDVYERTPKRTSNYVVFDDSIIDIRKKMALLLGLGGSGAAATQLPQRKPQ